MIVAVALLAISLSVSIYHHPPSTWRAWRGEDSTSGPNPRHGALSPKSDDGSRSSGGELLHPEPLAETESLSGDTAPSPQTTPKATPSAAQNGAAIPTFALTEHEGKDLDGAEDEDEDDNDDDDMPPPSFPALNSAQRASGPPPPSLVAIPPPLMASVSLMPPPQIKPSNLRALPVSAPGQSLRTPNSGLLPNRGPLPNRNPISGPGLPLVAGLTPTTPNARNRVLLSPGHSPLDWANLQRSGQNLSGVPSLIRVTPAMLKHHNGRKGRPAWSSYQGKVYNITPYLPFHPGGEGELRRAAGKDGGKLFMEVHPWVNWENMLGECLVGIAVSEEQEQALLSASARNGGSLEDMD